MATSSIAERNILLSIDGRIARIVLNRPDLHNSLEAEDITLFRSCLSTVAANDAVRVLIVTGAGNRTFCAGASLKQIHSGDMSGSLFETLTDDLARMSVPTICALNGGVYGGGVEIALCCDFRIGASSTRMSVPAARLGLCYPLGGLRRYVSRLGLNAALRILVANEEFGAAEMLRLGIVHELVDPDELEATTDALAVRITGLAPLAVQAMKGILTEVAGGHLDEAAARKAIERCAASEDLREGLRAQSQGDEPKFSGR